MSTGMSRLARKVKSWPSPTTTETLVTSSPGFTRAATIRANEMLPSR